MSDSEVWLPIKASPNYEVSSHGRVRSVDRIYVHSNGTKRRYRGRVLRLNTRTSGHRIVSVRLVPGCAKQTTFSVHTLVLEAFIGPRPPGLECCHGDGDPSNNHVDNLRWDTHAANMADMKRHGRDPRLNRTHCPRGHRLEHPNLDPSNLAKGKRACRACRNGISVVGDRQPQPLDREAAVQEAADRSYAKIAWPEESEAS